MVHGGDGTDEVSLAGETHVTALEDGAIRSFDFAPEEAGVERAPLAALAGGTAVENAARIEGDPGRQAQRPAAGRGAAERRLRRGAGRPGARRCARACAARGRRSSRARRCACCRTCGRRRMRSPGDEPVVSGFLADVMQEKREEIAEKK